jgi:hypothetical protein
LSLVAVAAGVDGVLVVVQVALEQGLQPSRQRQITQLLLELLVLEDCRLELLEPKEAILP